MNEWKPGVPKASQANNNNENTRIMKKKSTTSCVLFEQNPWWWNHHWRWRIWIRKKFIFYLVCLDSLGFKQRHYTQRESFQKNSFHKVFFCNEIVKRKNYSLKFLNPVKEKVIFPLFFQCVILINYFFGHRFSSINDQMIKW